MMSTSEFRPEVSHVTQSDVDPDVTIELAQHVTSRGGIPSGDALNN